MTTSICAQWENALKEAIQNALRDKKALKTASSENRSRRYKKAE
jgi:hypothetical protein